MQIIQKHWRWVSIILLGVGLNYIVNKVLDLRYGERSSFDPQEVLMAILFSFIVLEGSRWIRERLRTVQARLAGIPMALLAYPAIFCYIIFIVLGVGRLVVTLFYGGPNLLDEDFIILLLVEFFAFPVLAIDYLWKYKAELDEVNEQLVNKQEELRQFRKDHQSKIVIEASHGTQKMRVTPDQILMIYREHTNVYVVNRDYKRLVCNLSLEALEEMLPSNGFCRANRQFILTPDVIQSIKSGSYGKIELQLITKNNIPSATTVSRPSASSFRRWLSQSVGSVEKTQDTND